MGMISRQSVVYFLGTVFSVAVGYLFKIYVARVLGPEPLGIYALGMTAVSFGALFSGMGLPFTATRFVSIYMSRHAVGTLRRFLRRSLLHIFLTGLLSASVLIIGREWIAKSLYNDPRIAPFLLLLALLVPISTLMNFVGAVMRGYRVVAKRTLLEHFIQFPLKILLTIVLFSYGWALWGYIAAELAAAVAVLSVMCWIVWKLTPAGVDTAPTSDTGAGEASTFAWHMFILGFLGFVSGQFDRIVQGVVLDARQVGIYSIAMTTAVFIPILLTAVNSIFGPMIAELHANGEVGLLQRLYQILTKWIFGLTYPLVLVIVVLSAEFLGLFGASFRSASLVLTLLAIGQLVNVSVGSAGHLLLMAGRQKVEIRIVALSAGLAVALNLLLVPSMGLVGAGIAGAVCNATSNLLRLWQVKKCLGISPYNRHQLRLVYPIALSALAVVTFRASPAAGSWPDWAMIAVALAASYAAFASAALFFSLDDDDRTIRAAFLDTIRRAVARSA